MSHEPSLVALAPTRLLWLSGRASGLVTRTEVIGSATFENNRRFSSEPYVSLTAGKFIRLYINAASDYMSKALLVTFKWHQKFQHQQKATMCTLPKATSGHDDKHSNRVFSHDVTEAILVSQNNETAAMLVSQTSPVEIEKDGIRPG